MIKFFRFLLKFAIIAVIGIFAARLFYPLPSLENRATTTAIIGSTESSLGRSILPLVADNPGMSGVLALPEGPYAMATRVVLANAAEVSIDTQYYIWANDATGVYLLDALRRAALRGVRVRLLVDDNGTPGLDPELAALNEMENFEVRIFNPFILRKPRAVSYLFDFPRLNRRMHNKSFTVDGVATVIGGRNVGNVYFAYGVESEYYDLDVLAVGDAAATVGDNFDKFWASNSAYPADLIISSQQDGLAMLAASVENVNDDPETKAYKEVTNSSQLVQAMIDHTLALDWVKVSMVSDDPAKGLGKIDADQLMINRLSTILIDPVTSLDLVSAYFIPGDVLTGYLTGLAGNGVAVRTLTNSQEATDVLPVHSGYLLYRDALLDGGVDVYELKSHQRKMRLFEKFSILGASATSLHAKTFTIDNQRIFIGSFNFDPRSAMLNTEMGFLIESPKLAMLLTGYFEKNLNRIAYHVTRGENGKTLWADTDGDGNTTLLDTEPLTTGFTRGLVKFIGWLPVIWIL